MSALLRPFVSRSSRYTLRPQDKNVMRFSLETSSGGKGAIQETIMLNLSQTGVAFLVDAATAPSMGDRIMVEIPVPSGEQVAWWAKVVRMEEFVSKRRFSQRDEFFEDRKVIIGLRFEELPDAHGRALRKGIEDSFLKAMRDQRYLNWMYYKTRIRRAGELCFYALLAVAAVYFIYWLAQPDANYDAKRGAPWGDRIKF
jgi:hypothetical protein